MSTHNIGFYEEISKIITKLSSNIIKYAPYFFSWSSGLSSAWAFAQSDQSSLSSRGNLRSQATHGAYEPRSEKTGLRGF